MFLVEMQGGPATLENSGKYGSLLKSSIIIRLAVLYIGIFPNELKSCLDRSIYIGVLFAK